MHHLLAILLGTCAVSTVNAGVTRRNSGGCVAGPIQGTRCRAQCGVDYPGGDYAQQPVASFADCAALCNKNSQCTDAQYHRSNGYCYLKNRLTSSQQVSDVDSVICDGKVTTTKSTTTTTTTTTRTPLATTTKTTTTTKASIPPSVSTTKTTTTTTKASIPPSVSPTTKGTTTTQPSIPPSMTPSVTKTTTKTTTTTTTTTTSNTPTSTCASIPNPFISKTNPTKVYKITCNAWYYADNFVAAVDGGSLEKCIEICSNRSDCKATAIQRDSGLCGIYSAAGPTVYQQDGYDLATQITS